MTYPGNPGTQPGQFPQGYQPQYPPQQPQAQPMAPPAGAYQQPQQQQPAAPQVPQFADLNARIPSNSPDWPQELWGKPLREGIRYYNIAMEDFRRRNLPGGQQPLRGEPAPGQQQQPQQQRPQAPQQPQYQPPAPQAQAPQSFDAQSIQQMIAEGLRNALAPMQQETSQAVLNRVRARFPDWHQYHQQVMEIIGPMLQQDPSAGMREDLWESAFYLARGRAPQQLQTHQSQEPFYGSRGEIRTPPPPAPGTQPYFSEAPSAPGAASGGLSALTNDPTIISMARRFGIPVEEYILWMNGNVPQLRGA